MRPWFPALASLLVLACGDEPSGVEGEPPRPDDVSEPAPVDPGPAVTRRLTRAQYLASVRALFGDDLVLAARLERDLRIDGLSSLGAGVGATSPRGVEQFEEAAYEVAAFAVDPARRERWMPCAMDPSGPFDEACATEALRWVARRAWRRPVTEDDLTPVVDVSRTAAEALGDPHEGLSFGLAALLQSPWFLLRVERGEDDGSGGRRLRGHELATRLAFLLWNAPPDDVLLDAADAGELDTVSGIDGQAVRMLTDARARDGLAGWVTDLLHLEALDELEKDPSLFPNMSPTLGAAAKQEVLLGLEHLVFEADTDLRRWITQRRAFVDRELATIYRVEAPALEGFAPVELPEGGERRGLLGTVAFLAQHSHSTSTSATLRGLAIREALLCEPTPAPPAGVDTSIPEATGDRPTLRDRVQAHLTDPACAPCHEQMDLPGLALETFDAVGVWRTTENGAVIDTTGEFDDVPISGPSTLALAVADSPKFTACMVRQVVRRALGREPVEGEEAEVARLVDAFVHRERRLQPLWLEVASSPLFRQIAEVTE